MNTLNVGLITNSPRVDRNTLQQTAIAIQAQVDSPEFKLWGASGQVRCFDDIRILLGEGFVPIYIQDDINKPGYDGFHVFNNSPYAYVSSQGVWPHTVSHECLEMMVDRQGNFFLWGPSLIDGQGMVEYLVEICDATPLPVASSVNSIPVSDFYLPSFLTNTPGPYSAQRRLTGPLQLDYGGYICWRKGDLWFRADRFNDGTLYKQQIQMPQINASYRERIDYMTLPHMKQLHARRFKKTFKLKKQKISATERSAHHRHSQWLVKEFKRVAVDEAPATEVSKKKKKPQ